MPGLLYCQNSWPVATFECMANKKCDYSWAKCRNDAHRDALFLLSPQNKCRMFCLSNALRRTNAPYLFPLSSCIPATRGLKMLAIIRSFWVLLFFSFFFIFSSFLSGFSLFYFRVHTIFSLSFGFVSLPTKIK